MKWIFLIALLALTPALAMIVKSDRKWVPTVAFALALLPFLESGFNLAVAPISWRMWPGPVKGIEVSLVDAVAIALIVATGRVSTPTVLRASFGLYVVAFLISTAVAQQQTPAIFYGWQLVRAVIVYYAVARATASNPKVPLAILTGLIVGLTIQAGAAALQYVQGNPRAGGWFGHPNLLGMVSHFVVYPAFAVFLGGAYSMRTALVVGAAFVVAFVGGSRATIGLLVIGLGITALLSMMQRSSGRKATVVGLGLLAMVASAPILFSAVERRSDAARQQSNEERDQMKVAARMMAADHPLGVGANNYVMVANLGGYSARANVAWNEANRSAPVHNSYYLVTAEMNFLGLIGFISLLGCLAYLSLTASRRLPPGFDSDLALGAFVTILMVATHAYFEWIVMLFPVHMFLALTAGLIVGLRASRVPAVRMRARSQTQLDRPIAAQ